MLTPDDLAGLGLPFERRRRATSLNNDKSYTPLFDSNLDLEKAGQMMRWLEGFDPRAYKVIGLHLYLGLTFAEIADVMSAETPISASRVFQIFQRGIKRLRAKFAPQVESEKAWKALSAKETRRQEMLARGIEADRRRRENSEKRKQEWANGVYASRRSRKAA